MDARRWRRIQEVFHLVVEAAADERAAILADVADGDRDLIAQVEALLASDAAAATFLDRPATAWRDEDPDAVPALIGPYRPLEILGRGGMGVVYLAERADQTFDKRIALKVVSRELATPELARRFRAERQILADLEHPNIARLLDGGTTEDGRPYLVMEYVDGQPLDRFLDTHDLDLEARLDLFVKICDAVHTAHRNLVVHRDLKPGNILVTASGQPKLLDFGIAKLLAHPEIATTDPASETDARIVVTEAGVRPMTPAYASPEQLRGESVTTASDVYTLGLVLYEMLVGRSSKATAAHAKPLSVALADAAGLGHVSGAVRTDLDHLLRTALQDAPEARYPSAEALAADVERLLGGLPITARESTLSYRASRFVRRHRLAVAAVILAFAALSVLTITNVLQRQQTALQRDRAEEVSGFMIDLFEHANPSHARGEEFTVRELLDEGARQLERTTRRPEVLADLRHTMGEAYLVLGHYERAGALLTQALELRQQQLGDDHPEVAALLAELGRLRLAEGDFAAAEALTTEALAWRQEHLGDEHADTGRSLFNLAILRHRQGELDEAERLYPRAIGILRRAGVGADLLSQALSGQAALERDRIRYAEAERLQREALEALVADRGPAPDPSVVRLRTGLGTLLRRQGNFAAAEVEYRAALEALRALYPDDHPDTAVTLSHLSSVAARQGRYDEADTLLEEAFQLRLERLGERHPLVANTLNNRANLAADRGRLEDAEALYRDALALQTAALPDGHSDTANTRTNLGLVLADSGRYREAEALHRRALADYVALHGEQHANVAVVANNLARCLKAAGRNAEALPILERAVSTLRVVLGDDHPRLAIGLNNLAALYQVEGQLTAAADAYDEAITIGRERFGETHPTSLRLRLNRLLLGLEADEDNLEAPARDLLELCAAEQPGQRITAEARGVLGEVLARSGRRTEAETLLRQSLEELEALDTVATSLLDKARQRLVDLDRR
ncbi:MAG: serine/threonine-protein kinase [Acidobacteriota bacterium]